MDPAKLKVIELRAELSQRGLDTKGNKPVLVERLRKALEDESKNPPTEKIPTDSEDSSDIAQKDISDKVNESTRTLPPRTPGRASRSSSMSLSTPSKMSTRNAPKTATSPISMKQLSPSKPQNIEKPAEALPTISESPSEKAVVTEEDQSLPMSDREESNEVVPSEPVQTEAHNLVCTKPSNEVEQQEVVENDRKSEAEESNTAEISSTPELSEKTVSEDLALPSEKTESESGNSISPTAEEEEKTTEALNESEEKHDNDKKPVDMSEANDNMDYNDDDNNVHEEKENATEVDQDIQDEKEEIDAKNTESAESINEVQKNEDIPKEEQEEKMTDVTSGDTTQLANDEPIQDEQMKSETEEKELTEEDNVESHKENEEEKDVEMTEVKEEETKPEVVDSVNKNVHDRKRKRSPSPAERVKSPEVKQPEEEPEIDYSNVVLSWYDSDLNLAIDRNNFLSATPLHNDGFCYAWAGARASHGFVQGKVYYEAKITEECSINVQNEEHPHLLRVGWSVSNASLQLGEDKLSYGFDGTGKKVTENEFTDYGTAFGKDDVVGCYLDMTSESNVTISYTLNGKNLGVAFTISKDELADKALYPHILSKNCSYSCNFGQEDPWSEEILEEYVPVGAANPEDRVSGPQRPEKKEDCEIILMCGLPAAGKTCWAIKHASEHPEKMYNILGTQSLLEKMTVMGSSRKQHCSDKWDELVNKCTLAVNKLQEIAISRRRNYILDQTNVHLPTQRRKMKNFSGYQRKAVVVVPSDEEFKSRTVKRETADGKQFSDVSIMEMKANFSIPVVGEYFDAVEWVELNEEEGKKVIEMYNKEGKDAGFGQQPSKRPRFDRADNNRDNRDSRETRSNRDNRESRDSRDHRDRRPNYPDRNRNPPWRGGSNMGWRDRQRGGHMRHVGGGYGPGWRGGRSGPAPPPPHRNDRRGGGSGSGGGGGSNDRRTGGDRNRSVSSRQGGSWGPMNSNYQGSQSSGWGQSGNWSGGGQSSWGSQGGWGQPSQQWGGGSWKGYGQGSYGQSNYNQGYGNGNWNNSWNQQYYNQYWGQQQQSGQTTTPTTAAGGQAVSTTDSTMASSDNSEAPYSYSQGWQQYNAQSYSYPSAATSGQQSQQRK